MSASPQIAYDDRVNGGKVEFELNKQLTPDRDTAPLQGVPVETLPGAQNCNVKEP